MSGRTNWNLLKQSVELTEDQRRMYAAERGDNFRWVAQLLAACSPVTLTDTHLVHPEVRSEIEDIGQFAELVYSSIPIEVLLGQFGALSAGGFPLEHYNALKDATLEDFFYGTVARLGVAIFRRRPSEQLVVSIAGTTQLGHIVQDLRFLKTKHPSGKGNLHTGFWTLYTGIQEQVRACLLKALGSSHSKTVVITGHSMGGAVAYLMCIDILSREDYFSTDRPVIKLVTFGTPRVGDAALVDHFQDLVASYKEKHGNHSFIEYSVRGYNDGVPTLPPLKLGYRHFSREPLYATGDQLYTVPTSESEYTLFRSEGIEGQATCFPRGGHNYYNGRELERLSRHITWLEKANFPEIGWEERYKTVVQKSS